MSMCRVLYCSKKLFAKTSMFLWQNSVSFCPASLCIIRSNLPVIPGISWLSTFAFQLPMMKRTSFLMLVLESLVDLQELFSFFDINGLDIDLDYCDVEWVDLEMNQGHSIVFEIAPKYCTSKSFIDNEGSSTSSKVFLPTALDIMVFWIKFSHSYPFCSTDSWDVDVHSCRILLDHIPFSLIHGLDIPGLHVILFFTASDFIVNKRYIHSWVSFALWFSFPNSILDTYRTWGFIFWCYIFLHFHVAHAVLEAKILKWFATLFSSRASSVRALHHDSSILGGPHSIAHSFTEVHKAVIHAIIFVSFL